jgi:surface protein
VVSEWNSNETAAGVKYGDISEWDTSKVTDMSELFEGTEFSGDISGWNTGSVTDMSGMFYYATSFNGDISGWDTGSVTDMSGMFAQATSFNRDLSGWNTGSVTDMMRMFDSATSFNRDLSGWNAGSVTDMSEMFASATCPSCLGNGDLSSWNIGSATDISGMNSETEQQLKFNMPESGVCPSTLYPSGSYCYTCEGRTGSGSTVPFIGVLGFGDFHTAPRPGGLCAWLVSPAGHR